MEIFRPVRQYVDHRLRVRLRVFLVIWLIIISVIAVEVLRQNIDIGLAFVGSLIGLLSGFVLSRVQRLDWDQETTKVVSQLDWLGRTILATYILFMVGRNEIIGYWVQASSLMGFTLCFTGGTMIGRVGGTRRGIRKMLQAVGIINLEESGGSQA